jgi:hypothetical protein
VIDRKGKLVLISDSFGVEKRDFSLSPSGSITYVKGPIAFERKINGDLIWESKPLTQGTTTIYGYHHDITRLNNGHYLAMCKIKEKDTTHFRKNLDEGIVELDKNNKIYWLWKEHEHISDTSTIKTTHSNSIFLDEKKNTVYVSSRDINTIFIINRETGDIEKCIGRKISDKAIQYDHNWFAGQHSAQLLENGNILLFNNNAKPPAPGMPSGILEINNPNKVMPDVTPVFIYIYDFARNENHCAKGGDVNKLKNGNYLISSSANNRNFEINSASEIVWQCRPEKLDTITGTWSGIGSYRINYEPTLYPSFFIVDKVYSDNAVTGIKITNKGFKDDEYHVTIKNDRGKIVDDKIYLVPAGTRTIIELPKSQKITSIVVYTILNPTNKKELKFK